MEKRTLQEMLDRIRAELTIFYEIGNAMRTTLNLDEILFIILTGVTSHEGLGFNRAMLFLVNDGDGTIEGKMGIGPQSVEEAGRIWNRIASEQMNLEDLISAYSFYNKGGSDLDKIVRNIKVPLREDSGVLAMTVLEGMSFEITNEGTRQNIAHDTVLQSLKTEYFVTVPLRAKDKVIGVILADNIFTKKPITKDDIRTLTMFANHAGLAIENSRLYEQTVHQANTDMLTRLWNHGYFQYSLTEELKKAYENKKPLSMVMFDIDNFKNYNDTLGHQMGDQLLRDVARILKATCDGKGSVARYGGEEFAVILPDTPKDSAYRIAEGLRQAIEGFQFNGQNVQPNKNLTISAGLATYPEDALDKEKLIYLADMALYEAKRTGKNKVCVYRSK
ncbi:MAG: sensor domain-containing diguanylate cyclase [Candidatus Omnitrophica bacterium]|nr:sensor domain-containing diguanylate cyclase [Candidatus Omnitrophota bacterium]